MGSQDSGNSSSPLLAEIINQGRITNNMNTGNQLNDVAIFRSNMAKALSARNLSCGMGRGWQTFRYVGCAAIFLLLTRVHADDSLNLIDNGGFEMVATPRDRTADKWSQTLQERGVTFPLDAEGLPMSVSLNPATGWVDSRYVFEYLLGRPGEEVHSGERAVRIAGANEGSAITIGKVIPVVAGDDDAVGAMQVGRSYKYSFFAKGKGYVRPVLYMFETVEARKNLYDYEGLQTFVPAKHTLTQNSEWIECAGTVTINSAEVGAVILALTINGEVWIDDVQITP